MSLFGEARESRKLGVGYLGQVPRPHLALPAWVWRRIDAEDDGG